MTIDEAILLERETVRRNKMMLELNKLMQESHVVCFDKLKRETSIRIHEQIAEWLEELKEYKSLSPMELVSEKQKNDRTIECNKGFDYGFKTGYNKSIYDFAEKVIQRYHELPTTLGYTEEIVKEIAEQLKEGVENE